MQQGEKAQHNFENVTYETGCDPQQDWLLCNRSQMWRRVVQGNASPISPHLCNCHWLRWLGHGKGWSVLAVCCMVIHIQPSQIEQNCLRDLSCLQLPWHTVVATWPPYRIWVMSSTLRACAESMRWVVTSVCCSVNTHTSWGYFVVAPGLSGKFAVAELFQKWLCLFHI